MSRNKIALGSNRASKDEAPEWETVAYEFVCRYYSLLERQPDRLQCFYKEQSCFSFSRGIQGSPNIESRAVGQDLIHAELSKALATFKGQSVKVEVSGFQCQGGFTNATGVLVHITGYIVPVAAPLERQHFTQSFLLERQTEPRIGFFVLNDFLRYSPMSYHDGPMAMGPPMALGSAQAAARQEVAKAYDEEEDEREAKVSIELEEEDGGGGAEAQELADAMEQQVAEYLTGPAAGTEQDEVGGAPEDEDGEAAYREEPDGQERQAQEPKTWASMAGRLQSAGGGQLGPSKSVGFAAAPQRAAQAAAATTAGATSKGTASGKGGSRAVAAASNNGASAEGTQHQSGASSGGGRQWLWVSRLPTEPLAENQEILDCFNSLLEACSSQGKALELERRDPSQEWANLSVSSQEAAETLVSLSKSRQILLRNRPLKAEHHRGRPMDRKAAFGRGSGSGRDFKGFGGGTKGSGSTAAEGGGEEERSASAAGDGRGGARPKRRAVRGDQGAQGGSGQGDQSSQGAAAGREQQHQATRSFGGGAGAGGESGACGRASSGAYSRTGK